MGFSLNYLANIPEVIDLATETRRRLPHTSWYDYAETRVGLYHDPAAPAETEWYRLTWHAAHEMAHFLVNFSPAQSGARDRTDAGRVA